MSQIEGVRDLCEGLRDAADFLERNPRIAPLTDGVAIDLAASTDREFEQTIARMGNVTRLGDRFVRKTFGRYVTVDLVVPHHVADEPRRSVA